MVVEQEMAEVYPPSSKDLSELLSDIDCGDCGFPSCIEFATAVLGSKTTPQKCPELSQEFGNLLVSIVKLQKDPIPYNIMMEQEPCELIEVNNPSKSAPLLITCNFRETIQIMKKILEKTGTKAFLLPTQTHGYSVDNAVHERMFKAIEIWKAMQENTVSEKMEKSVMVIPGLAESERNSIKQLTRWDVLVGPVSGFLTPLFLLQNDL
jgi:CO dehydrogenase/acetyl-CoA synthase gamma subunit (corrinoid Fe-S protein)